MLSALHGSNLSTAAAASSAHAPRGFHVPMLGSGLELPIVGLVRSSTLRARFGVHLLLAFGKRTEFAAVVVFLVEMDFGRIDLCGL